MAPVAPAWPKRPRRDQRQQRFPVIRPVFRFSSQPFRLLLLGLGSDLSSHPHPVFGNFDFFALRRLNAAHKIRLYRKIYPLSPKNPLNLD